MEEQDTSLPGRKAADAIPSVFGNFDNVVPEKANRNSEGSDDLADEYRQHQKIKRQVTESTSITSSTNTIAITDDGSSNSSLLNLPEPLFFPRIVGNFQLALKSNTSIIIVVGNDHNIYLSNQPLTGTSPATFSLVDLMVSNETDSALIQDALTQRYLHCHNDVQENGYSRVRTHLDTYMPCNANIIFWTFQSGYLQFYRGGQWVYDTVGCLDRLTGLVKIWIVNGQQGLTALQTAHGTCGLAPLIAINHD